MPAIAAAQQAPSRPAAAPAAAQAPEQDEGAESDEIVVTGSRKLPGAVIGDIPPDQTLGQAEIRSYGVSTVSDLLNELSPQTTSGRGSGGAPVVLLNGRRISSFSEIRDIPTEAIQRVEILPEEVALKYGYRADQKVVNFVLRRRFRAVTAEAADTQATEGGGNTPKGSLDMLNIARDRRLNLHVEYTSSEPLTESQRDILQPQRTANSALGADGAVVDQRPFRTLQSATSTFTANSVYARNIFGNIGATINGRLESTDSRSLNGLPVVTLDQPGGPSIFRALEDDGVRPLTQRTSSIAAHLGTTLNGDIGKWRWNVTGNYDRSDTQTFTETGVDASAFNARIGAGDLTANPLGRLRASDFGALPGNRAYATQSTGEVDAVANGTLFAMPAGAVSTTIKLGAETADFKSRSYRTINLVGIDTQGRVSRDTVNGQINVDVPLTSRSKNVLPFLGTLSANFNLAEDHLSDFGTLQTLGYGANWSPIEGVRVIASVTDTDEAPTAQQLGNPAITTPNVRVFDYVRGETATVTTISGGNPGLVADNNHVKKVGLTIKPWSAKDLSITANYVESRVDNPIAAFPAATAAIEAAFPDRFQRDAGGALLQVDRRPINFARSDRSELRWGINFSAPLKSKIQRELEAYRAGTGLNPFEGLQPPGGRRPGGAGGAGGDGPRGDGARAGGGPGAGGPGGGGGGGRGFGGRGGQAGGRIQFAVYHTWHFTDRVLVADGGPSLNLLNGDAIGNNGGQARHELEAQAGYTNNGLGARISANYATGTRVNGGTIAAPETLNFGGLATANARLFADLGQRLEWVKAHPWLRGMRVSLAVNNVFNTRQRVTDATGVVPNTYQPDYLDPLGRTVRLSIRKLFF